MIPGKARRHARIAPNVLARPPEAAARPGPDHSGWYRGPEEGRVGLALRPRRGPGRARAPAPKRAGSDSRWYRDPEDAW